MHFVAWLRNKEATIKIDFGKHCISKWKISNNKMILEIVDTDGTENAELGTRRIEEQYNLEVESRT